MGTISTFAGTGAWGYSGDGGPATAAKSKWLYSVVVALWGDVYIADAYNLCIRKVRSDLPLALTGHH